MIEVRNNVRLISLSSIALFSTWIAVVIALAPFYQNLAGSESNTALELLLSSTSLG